MEEYPSLRHRNGKYDKIIPGCIRILLKEHAGEKLPEEALAEVERSLQSFREEGFASSAATLPGEDLPGDGGQLSEPGTLFGEEPEDTFFLTNDPEILSSLQNAGCHAAGYHPAGCVPAPIPGAAYIIEEPDQLERDTLIRIYRRLTGAPWDILTTKRCLIREMTTEDFEQTRQLYDTEASEFLEAPGEGEEDRTFFSQYIQKVYPFFGYGMWAVILKETGQLIGRAGFEHSPSGGSEVFLGFLIGKQYRRQGIAGEICTGILWYGTQMLGFDEIFAEADKKNTVSLHLLRRLGFADAGRAENGNLLLRYKPKE